MTSACALPPVVSAPWDRDLAAREVMPLARHLASKAAAKVPALAAELESAAMLGLADALDRFEPERGLKFATFALPRIRGAILDAMRNEWPRGYGRAFKGERPDIVSMNAPAHADERGVAEYGSTLAADADSAPGRLESDDALASALRGLTNHERGLVLFVYRDGGKPVDYARRIGLSESRISQVHASALKFLARDPRVLARLTGEPVPEPRPIAARRPQPDPKPEPQEPPVSLAMTPDPMPEPAPLGDCPGCGKPFGKRRRCFACKPSFGPGAGTRGPAAASPPAIEVARPRLADTAPAPSPSPLIAELDAMRGVALAVEPLSPAARTRVLAWAAAAIGVAS